MESSLPASEGGGLSQAPGHPILALYLAEAPQSAPPLPHPCPSPGVTWLPSTSYTCFCCILFRQEMGMRWEKGKKGSLSLPHLEAGSVGSGGQGHVGAGE